MTNKRLVLLVCEVVGATSDEQLQARLEHFRLSTEVRWDFGVILDRAKASDLALFDQTVDGSIPSIVVETPDHEAPPC